MQAIIFRKLEHMFKDLSKNVKIFLPFKNLNFYSILDHRQEERGNMKHLNKRNINDI